MKNRIITFFIIITMIMLLIPSSVYALKNESEISIDISGIEIGGTSSVYTANSTIEVVLGVLQVLGTIASVIALMIIGIRYMISSLEERANMKGVLIYYIIGAVLVFATPQILQIIYDVVWNIPI